MYNSALECCEASLSYLGSSNCASISETGGNNNSGSGKWYAATSDIICMKDCDPIAANDELCGGIVSYRTLYASELECCTNKFGWYSSELCVAKSVGNYTNKFYADYAKGQKCA